MQPYVRARAPRETCNMHVVLMSAAGAGARSPGGPRRTHRHHPEQRAGLARFPQATAVAVRPARRVPSGSRVRSAARRQVREANRTHRAGPGRAARRAPRTADDQGLSVRSAERRRLPATAAASIPRDASRLRAMTVLLPIEIPTPVRRSQSATTNISTAACTFPDSGRVFSATDSPARIY